MGRICSVDGCLREARERRRSCHSCHGKQSRAKYLESGKCHKSCGRPLWSKSSCFACSTSETLTRAAKDTPRKQFIDWILEYDLESGFVCGLCNGSFPQQLGGNVGMQVDHIVPLSRGGTRTLDNIQLLCAPCNWMKRDRLEHELIEHVKVLYDNLVASRSAA